VSGSGLAGFALLGRFPGDSRRRRDGLERCAAGDMDRVEGRLIPRHFMVGSRGAFSRTEGICSWTFYSLLAVAYLLDVDQEHSLRPVPTSKCEDFVMELIILKRNSLKYLITTPWRVPVFEH
jgi:hypothetical protein